MSVGIGGGGRGGVGANNGDTSTFRYRAPNETATTTTTTWLSDAIVDTPTRRSFAHNPELSEIVAEEPRLEHRTSVSIDGGYDAASTALLSLSLKSGHSSPAGRTDAAAPTPSRCSVGVYGGGAALLSSGMLSSSPSSSGRQAARYNDMNAIRESSSVFSDCRRPSADPNNRCLICLSNERTSTIVHGETGHIVCCLACARILKGRGDNVSLRCMKLHNFIYLFPSRSVARVYSFVFFYGILTASKTKCPVCRLPIDLVIQHFWA